MNNNIKYAIFKSLFLTTIISIGFSGIFAMVYTRLNIPWAIGLGFVVVCVLQYLISALSQKEVIVQETVVAENTINTAMSCAYCNKISSVNVDMNGDESVYVCPNCNQTNRVMYQFMTTRITVPLAETTTHPLKEVNIDGSE